MMNDDDKARRQDCFDDEFAGLHLIVAENKK